MSTLRKTVLVLGIALAVLVNISGAMRPKYKGVQEDVGDDVVSVYACENTSGELAVPVQRRDESTGKWLPTGQKVQVYLRCAYKDDIVVLWPRDTLRILGTTILLYFGIGLFRRRRKPA